MASASIFAECETEEDVHNKLMTTFCCDYFGAESWKEKFEKFKLKSFLYLKTPKERGVSNAYDVWSKLEAKGILGQNKYDVLKRLVDEIDDDLLSLIEDAEEKISLLKGEGYQKRKRRKKEHEKDYFQSLKQTVLEFSKRTTENVPVSPFQQYGMLPVELLYAKVVVKTDPRYDEKGRHVFEKSKLQRGRKLNVEGPNDLFYKDKEPAKQIFMTGSPAHGKTTYCIWLLQHWLNSQLSNNKERQQKEWRKALGIFDFVFLIKLRDVQKSRAYATDMICKDILQLDDESSMLFKEALKSKKYRSLILIDGLDEWRPDQNVTKNTRFRGLPLMDDIKNCVTFITMRNWKFESVAMNVNSNDRVVEIEGLDDNGIKEVTENVLKNYYALDIQQPDEKQKYDTIMNKLKNKTMNSIMKIPLMAVVCVQIWYKGKDIGDSLTQFYIEMIEMLIERAEKPHDVDNALEIVGYEGVYFQSYKHVLGKLGKLAYNGVISNEFSFEFPAKTLTNSLGLTESEVEFSLNVGILSMEETDSIMTKKVKLFFFHTSVEEFLAAKFINDYDKMTELYSNMSSIGDILKFSNVLIFLTGLNPVLGSKISKWIADAADADATISSYRKFSRLNLYYKNSKIELVFDLQISCYKEMTYAQQKTGAHRTRPEHVIYCISDLLLHNDSDHDTIRVSADIIQCLNADIKLIYLWILDRHVNQFIPNSLLNRYLEYAVSLKSLCLDGSFTEWTIQNIDDKFAKLTALILYDITLTPEAITALSKALQSNTWMETLGLVRIECKVNEDKGRRQGASLNPIIQILPDIQNLSTLRIGITNKDDKPVFRNVISRLNRLDAIEYYSVEPWDDGYDHIVVQTLCTWSGLRWIYLSNMNLGDGGLQLSNNIHLESVLLHEVHMSTSAWNKFILSMINLDHTIEVDFCEVKIDKKVLKTIRSSPNFNIINKKVYDEYIRNLELEFIPSRA